MYQPKNLSMRAADLLVKKPIRAYRRSINPPYQPSDLLTIAATIFILLVIPLTVITVLQSREPRSRAAGPVRRLSGDLVADIVIGQPNFNEIAPNSVVGNRLSIPYGAVIDRNSTPQVLYVYDAGNSRVLVLDWDQCLAQVGNCSAVK